MANQKNTSRIDTVKIYSAGATITRIAQLNITTEELPAQIEITEFPLALDDSSVRVRVEIEEGKPPIANDIRISLAVPTPAEAPNFTADEELRTAKIEVTKIAEIIKLIENEITILNQLEVPDRPDYNTGIAPPPPSPMSARLALANFSDEQIRQKIKEKREYGEKLQKLQEKLADLEQQKTLASTARNIKPEALIKTVIVSLSYEKEASFYWHKNIQIFVEYFVPGARWTPTYVCRVNSRENQATIALRALICHQTGEDWSNVKLELSTANPNAWCEIPELPSLRFGKMQPEVKKIGWRKPPVGADILFEDFDRQKESLQILTSTVKVNKQLLCNQKLVQLESITFNQIQPAQIPSQPEKRPLTEVLEAITRKPLPPELQRQYKKQQLFKLKILYGVEAFDPELIQIGVPQIEQMLETLSLTMDNCRRLGILPLSQLRSEPPLFLIAMTNPDNLEAQDELNRIMRPKEWAWQRRVITREDYEQLIKQYLNEELKRQKEREKQERAARLELLYDEFAGGDLQDAPDDTEDLDMALAEYASAPIVNTVNKILAKALSEGVSDIYIEPQEENMRVRMRKDGVLQEYFVLPKKVINAITSRFKIISDLDITEKRQSQDGWIERIFQGKQIVLWVKTVPTSLGEKILIFVPTSNTDSLAYNIMRIGEYDNIAKRGKLSIETQPKAYLEILKAQKLQVDFDILEIIKTAISNAKKCLSSPLPPGASHVREIATNFDYFYSADSRLDIPADGQFHSVALTSKTTDVNVRYVVVPREDTNVFRIVQLRNPIAAPLLQGPADVYVDDEYILSTNIATVPPQGLMELGLGVEQAIKVARNTSYSETRSSETILAFNQLRHHITIEISNYLSRNAKIEVRERLPIPEKNAKVEIEIEKVSPEWKQYNQQERDTPIQGGYCWHLEITSKERKTLSVDYTIKTFLDNELIGGNRRE